MQNQGPSALALQELTSAETAVNQSSGQSHKMQTVLT